ncbi:PREDICTED: uncharacterized protein LOC104751609 [Camelina sativa]|uniref:Uncharacterized protein LOC104751609 n=1 Tax=Camelina sativa TaxID=90675 RepID=A0ABM0WJA5_CAMSA|nr:PREDICTED: uncharacterized protein LOC104751609 [Camelina sativa]
MDGGKCNCGDGGKSGTAQKDSNMKNPGPTISLIENDSEQMIFSSEWLDEQSDRSGIIEYKCKTYCVWTVKAAKTNNNGFKIKEYIGPHSCKPANVSSDFLAGELKGLIKGQPSLSVAELNMWVKEEFGCTVSCTNMRDAKKKAFNAILRDLDNSFNRFPKFMAALSSSNKMCFGRFNSQLLVAAGFDAENRFFPLAFAITTQESLSADTWRWFFACIRDKVTQREGLCLITSLSPDIVEVVNEPECLWAQHRFCLRHLCLKFYDVFHNNLMTELVYKAGSTRDKSSFEYYLKKIEKMDPEARKWLEKMPLYLWALAYDDGGIRFGIMTTNTIFKTYGFIDNLRIITCIFLIFDHLAELFKSRHGRPADSPNGIDQYAKHVMTNLEEYKVASQTHDVLPLEHTGERFQVTEMMQVGEKRFVVHFSNRVCTCGIWQLCKYPCSHVIAVCRRMNSDHLQYINDYYNTESSLRGYAAAFNPLPGVSDWPEASEVPRLLPPGTLPPSVVCPVTTELSRNDTSTSKLVVGRKRSNGKKQA